MFHNRRQFLQRGLLTTAATVTPGLWGAIGPARRTLGLSELPTVGMIGIGLQGRGLLNQFLWRKVVVKTVCDCDRVRRDDALRRVQEYYAEHADLGIPKDACRAESDFRKVIEDPAIDMVCIATPDHWHAYMVVEAMKHGKDVYCEKPLTYSVDEARTIVEVAKKTGRILQVGAMQRSSFEFRAACELVRNGFIGDVKYVENQFGGPACPRRPYKDFQKFAAEGAPNPDVDFNMWLGPAPNVPYSDELAPRGVHNFFPGFWREDDFFGSGGCGDWGAHHMDITQWGMGKDGSGPVRVVKSAESRSNDWNRGFRRQNGARLIYEDGLELLHVGGTRWGTVFFGTRGILCVDRGRIAFWEGNGHNTPDRKMREALSEGTFDGNGMKKICYYNGKYKRRVNGVETEIDTATEAFGRSSAEAVKKAERFFGVDFKKHTGIKLPLYESGNHVENFVQCVKERRATISSEDVGPYTSVLCQLVHMSYVHDTGFDWDPKKMTFANGAGDPEWLSRREIRPDANRYKVQA